MAAYFFGSLIEAHAAATVDTKQARHQLILALHLLLNQEEGDTVRLEAAGQLDILNLGR